MGGAEYGVLSIVMCHGCSKAYPNPARVRVAGRYVMGGSQGPFKIHFKYFTNVLLIFFKCLTNMYISNLLQIFYKSFTNQMSCRLYFLCKSQI